MAGLNDYQDYYYAENPNYLWQSDGADVLGRKVGRWVIRPGSDLDRITRQQSGRPPPTDPNSLPPAGQGSASGETWGTPGGMGQVLNGFFDWVGGKPFGDKGKSGGVLDLSVPDDARWSEILRNGANARPRANPYNNATADQTRNTQLELLGQMRAQQAGPSIANMQGQGAMGQNLQAALQARGPNAGVASRAGAAGAGLGADVARARLAEQMQMSAQQGNAASGLRGRDQQSALNSSQAALQAQSLDNTARQFYGSRGASFDLARRQADFENYKLAHKLKQAGRSANSDAIMGYFNTMASIASKGATSKGK